MTKKEQQKIIKAIQKYSWQQTFGNEIEYNKSFLIDSVKQAMEVEEESYAEEAQRLMEEAYSPTKHISGKFGKGVVTSTKERDYLKYMKKAMGDTFSGLEEKQLPPDKTIIKDCLGYIAHKIKKHPESYASRVWESWLPRIDELRKPDTFCGMPVSDSFYVEKSEKREDRADAIRYAMLKNGFKTQYVKKQQPKKIERIKNGHCVPPVIDKVNELIDYLNNPSGDN